LYGLSCFVCDIGNAFSHGKINEDVYINAGPEFGASLNSKNLIIDKSLYGFKISAARFHEHLSESLLRLGFKNTNMTLIYGWWTRYVDDILIWSKDPMAVIKSLKKTYMLKSLGIPE
jgi:hypothetical protein